MEIEPGCTGRAEDEQATAQGHSEGPRQRRIPQEAARGYGTAVGMEEERAHLPSVLGSAVRGHSLTGCLTLRCCRACPSGELLRESERLEMYLDLPWRWVKGEEGLALGLPKL